MLIKYPYLVVSDLHLNDWTFGAHETPEGINSRLQTTLHELSRAAEKLKFAGGNDIIITGDLFHTRGLLKPAVYNPVYKFFVELCQDFNVFAIPGNHDLETQDSSEIGNIFTSFDSINHFHVINASYRCSIVGGDINESGVFWPWQEYSHKYIVNAFSHLQASKTSRSKLTIFTHLGLSNVLPHLEGLNPNDFKKIKDIKNVFCGHYHNHKHWAFTNDDGQPFDVYSVGALTHHNFKDVDSKAGYLIVYPYKAIHTETEAPKFVDYDMMDHMKPLAELKPEDFSGNFVRISKTLGLTDKEAASIKIGLEGLGALRVIDNSWRVEEKFKFGDLEPPIGEPSSYVFGRYVDAGDGLDKLTESIKRYMLSRYNKILAERMIEKFLKEDFTDE